MSEASVGQMSPGVRHKLGQCCTAGAGDSYDSWENRHTSMLLNLMSFYGDNNIQWAESLYQGSCPYGLANKAASPSLPRAESRASSRQCHTSRDTYSHSKVPTRTPFSEPLWPKFILLLLFWNSLTTINTSLKSFSDLQQADVLEPPTKSPWLPFSPFPDLLQALDREPMCSLHPSSLIQVPTRILSGDLATSSICHFSNTPGS